MLYDAWKSLYPLLPFNGKISEVIVVYNNSMIWEMMLYALDRDVWFMWLAKPTYIYNRTWEHSGSYDALTLIYKYISYKEKWPGNIHWYMNH